MLSSKLTDVVKFEVGLFPGLGYRIAELGIKALCDIENSVDTAENCIASLRTSASEVALNFFTTEESADIKARIDSFQNSKATGKNARSGGSQLLKELEKVEHAKSELLKWIANIRTILAPAVVTKVTSAEIRAKAESNAAAKILQAEHDSITRLAATFVGMKESLLRQFGEIFLGKEEQNYLKEELPLVIATKQITGVILAPKEL